MEYSIGYVIKQCKGGKGEDPMKTEKGKTFHGKEKGGRPKKGVFRWTKKRSRRKVRR